MLAIICSWILADVIGIVLGIEVMRLHGALIGSLAIAASASRLLAIFYMYCANEREVRSAGNVVSISGD